MREPSAHSTHADTHVGKPPCKSGGKPPHSRGFAVLLAMLMAFTSFAAEPNRKELWVPSKHWSEIQRLHPNAVHLTPEQYDALVRDAFKTRATDDPKLKPPVEATVESILFKTKLDPARDTTAFTGEVVVRCFTDQWTTLAIRLPFPVITSVVSEAGEHLALSTADKDNVRNLLVRGKGIHHLFVEASAPITTLNESSKQSLAFDTSTNPGELQVELPAQATVINRELSFRREGNIVHVPLSQLAGIKTRILNWSTGDTSMQRRLPSKEPNLAKLTLSEQTLTAQWSLTLEHLGTSPAERALTFDVTPADTVIESITGELVKQWKPLTSGKVEVTIAANHNTTAKLALTLSAPLNISDTAQPILVPTVTHREQITQSLHAQLVALDDDLALLELRSDLTTWLPNEAAPQLIVRKAKPRIIADADALVTVTKDDLRIERTLAISTDRAINELRVTLPDDERFDDTQQTTGPAFDWKRIGQIIEYRWPTGLTANTQSKLTLRTSKPLTARSGGDTPVAERKRDTPVALQVSPLLIPDAAKLTGYLALNYDTTWRANLTDTTGLEERDVKLTPVKGRMAWFSLRSFKLGFTVQRRDPVVDVEVVAYALPRARSIDIEGVLQLRVSEAPLREFKVRFDQTSAPQVRFTSDNISERKLDAATGEWTLTLRQEAQGVVPVRWAVSQRSEVKDQTDPSDQSDPTDLSATYQLPTIALPTARRFTGTWVIEANTDTEITFTPKAMQPLDVLHVPVIDGYQPRHRLVAAHTYATADAALTLHAARHGHSELAALLVNSLALRSVLATDGTTRHEATLQVLHNGEQYLTIALPANATLLSALANTQPVKPVRGPSGSLSIPLPATSATEPHVQVRLLYETADPAWLPTGQRKLEPPTLIPNNIPILATDWEVFTPDGYSFGKVKTDLEQEGTGVTSGSWRDALGMLMPSSSPVFRSLHKIGSVDEVIFDNATRRERELTPLEHAENRKRFETLGKVSPIKKVVSTSTSSGITLPDTEMVEIHPKFPKPMFVGTPVPAPEGFKMVEPRESEFVRNSKGSPASGGTANYYINNLFETMRIPQISFSNATLEEAIEFLRGKSRDLDDLEHDPLRKGINLILKSGDPQPPLVTLDLKDVTFGDALKRITELTGTKIKIEPHAVLIVPITESSTEQYTRVYKVPPNFTSLKLPESASAAPADPFAKPDATAAIKPRASAKDILMSSGIPFPDGAAAVFNPTTSQLIVKDTQANLDLVDSFVSEAWKQAGPDAMAEQVPVEAFRVGGSTLPPSPSEGTVSLLRMIRLPLVSFAGATMNEAVAFFESKARELTPKGQTAPKFILQSGDTPSTATITLELKDVPLEEALRYCTELAGMKSKVEPGRVVIVPISESTTEQFTRVYKVTPEIISSLRKATSGPLAANDPFASTPATTKAPTDPSPRELFMAQGIPFPEGSSVVLSANNEVIVKNTAPNLDLVESLLSSEWSKSKQKPPFDSPELRQRLLRELTAKDQSVAPAAAAPAGVLPPLDRFGDAPASADPFASPDAGFKSGLLTLLLDLPTAGQRLHFTGLQAPTTLELGYRAWERQVTWACALMLAGAGLFVAWGRRRPVMFTLLAVLVLALGVSLIVEDWQPSANALLLGWLAALGIALVWRGMQALNTWINRRRAVV